MEKGRKPDLMSLCLATLALTRENTVGNRSIRLEIDPSHDFNFTGAVHAGQINQVRNGPRCGRDKKQSGGGSLRP